MRLNRKQDMEFGEVMKVRIHQEMSEMFEMSSDSCKGAIKIVFKCN